MMQTSSLRYFLMVARCGSIAAASTRLHVASSAISRQIANLEDELGCVLFERRPRGMVTSPAGDLLVRHANHVLMRTEQVAADIASLQGVVRGLVRVATTEGFALDVLPSVIAGLHTRFTGIRFELAVVPPSRVTQIVATGEADVGLTFDMAHDAGVAVACRVEAPMIGICATDHPLAGASAVSLTTLRDYPVVLMPEDTTSRQVFDAACRDAGVAIEPAMVTNALPSILSFVAQTAAVAPLASLSVRGAIERGEFGAFSLEDDLPTGRMVQVQVMRDRQLPEAIRIFVEELKSFFQSPRRP